LTHITEITGMEDDVVSMQDVFVFEKQGVSPEGRTLGTFTATGIRPKFAEKLAASGISLPAHFFEQSVNRWN
jgi:pilus assembly protein CpaF